MARWARPSSVPSRCQVASSSSSVTTTPDRRDRMASNRRSPASRPSPKPARATPAGLACAQRWAAAHSAAADAAPSGRVGPSARYSTTGATPPSSGLAASAAKNASANAPRLCAAAARNGARSWSLRAPAASTSRAWISGSARGPSGAVEHRVAEVEHVAGEVEVEERRLVLLELGRRRQHDVRQSGRLGHAHVDHDERVERSQRVAHAA